MKLIGHETIGFHLQQAVEKSTKSLLARNDVRIEDAVGSLRLRRHAHPGKRLHGLDRFKNVIDHPAASRQMILPSRSVASLRSHGSTAVLTTSTRASISYRELSCCTALGTVA